MRGTFLNMMNRAVFEDPAVVSINVLCQSGNKCCRINRVIVRVVFSAYVL